MTGPVYAANAASGHANREHPEKEGLVGGVKEILETEEKLAWCQNSRRWLFFMDFRGQYPETCPYQGQCHRCGYFQEREPTRYILRKLGALENEEPEETKKN
jgi:hypothetical protein